MMRVSTAFLLFLMIQFVSWSTDFKIAETVLVQMGHLRAWAAQQQ
jgi:hypothetical protein